MKADEGCGDDDEDEDIGGGEYDYDEEDGGGDNFILLCLDLLERRRMKMMLMEMMLCQLMMIDLSQDFPLKGIKGSLQATNYCTF